VYGCLYAQLTIVGDSVISAGLATGFGRTVGFRVGLTAPFEVGLGVAFTTGFAAAVGLAVGFRVCVSVFISLH
jgi:hypothetical protein